MAAAVAGSSARAMASRSRLKAAGADAGRGARRRRWAGRGRPHRARRAPADRRATSLRGCRRRAALALPVAELLRDGRRQRGERAGLLVPRAGRCGRWAAALRRAVAGGGVTSRCTARARGELRELIERLDLIVQGAAHAFGAFVRGDRQAFDLGAQARLLGGNVGGGAGGLLAHFLGSRGEAVAERAELGGHGRRHRGQAVAEVFQRALALGAGVRAHALQLAAGAQVGFRQRAFHGRGVVADEASRTRRPCRTGDRASAPAPRGGSAASCRS